MASKVKRGFLYYILWVLFIIVGITCIFASILIFNPGVDVFGINLRWINDNKKVEYQKVDDKWLDSCSYSTIEFNSNYTNFAVVRNAEYSITTFQLNKKIVGLSNSKTNYAYSTTITLENNTLKITVNEPELSLPLGPNATMTMYCPKELNLDNISFVINTVSGNIKFGTTDIHQSANIKDLKINTQSGAIHTYDNVTILSGNLDIKSTSSDINVFGNVANTLNIETQNSSININKISGNLNLTSTELKLTCDEIAGNVKFSGSKGYIKIDKLGGNFTSEIDKTSIANIIIKDMQGSLTLPSAKASNITVTNLYGEALIETTSGNVTIENAYNNLAIKTLTGDVTFTQNNATAYSNVETNKGDIEATFNNIKTSNLASEEGDITIYVKDGLQFIFDYYAEKSITVSWITQSLAMTDSILSPTANNSTTNTITAITKRNIAMHNFQ